MKTIDQDLDIQPIEKECYKFWEQDKEFLMEDTVEQQKLPRRANLYKKY